MTIAVKRLAIRQHLRDNPSLRPWLDQAREDSCARAVIQAGRQTRPGAFPLGAFPLGAFLEACPFTFDQAIDHDFWPDA